MRTRVESGEALQPIADYFNVSKATVSRAVRFWVYA
jgi:hypothetical protein